MGVEEGVCTSAGDKGIWLCADADAEAEVDNSLRLAP